MHPELVIEQLFNKETHLNEEGISLYVDALLLGKTPLLPVAILEHVSSCKQCMSDITEVYQLLADEPLDKEEHPFFIERGKTLTGTSTVFRVAAILFLTIGVATVVYFYIARNNINGGTHEPPNRATLSDTTHIQPDGTASKETRSGNLLASTNFEASPELEELTHLSFRSSQQEIISPALGTTVSLPIRFAWMGKHYSSYELQILTNKGKVVKALTIHATHYLWSDQLDPGLYYWKLLAKDQLLLAGKFIIAPPQQPQK